jgi:predicted HTH transcriptional regulator
MNLTKFDEEFLKFLISSKESKTLDFKQKVTSKEKIARTLAAMANTDGGYILIGLSDQKKIIGIDPEEEKFMIESANEVYCIPRVSLSCESFVWPDSEQEKKSREDIHLLLVTVKKSEGPQILTLDKNGNRKLFIRVNDQTRSSA